MHDVCTGIEAAGKALFRGSVLEGFEYDVIVKERAMSNAEIQQWKQITDAMRAEESEQPSLGVVPDLKLGSEAEAKVICDYIDDNALHFISTIIAVHCSG